MDLHDAVNLSPEEVEALYWEIITSSVDEGWIYLEEHGPKGWHSRINLETLNVACVAHCVLGQVYGHYGKGAARLDLREWELWAMGLYVPTWLLVSEALNGRDPYGDLTAEWRKRLVHAA